MYRFHRLRFTAVLIVTALIGTASAAPPPGTIVTRSYENYSGDDLISRVTFTLEYDDGKTRRMTVVMAYKRYERHKDLASKVIMFNEYPPDKKDIAFLAWIYRSDSRKEDDMWLYLPELRQVRKLTHKHEAHSHEDTSSDAFSVSELNREELTPRRPDLDHHRLLGEDSIDGDMAYRVESVPKEPGTSTYGKLIQWIAQDTFLPVRIDYYDKAGTLLKTQTIEWLKRGEAWVWDRVTAVNRVNGNRTVLDQSDIQINMGLPDYLFSKRVMKQGAQAFLARVSRAVD